jgi:hypothetical protein
LHEHFIFRHTSTYIIVRPLSRHRWGPGGLSWLRILGFCPASCCNRGWLNVWRSRCPLGPASFAAGGRCSCSRSWLLLCKP